MDVRRRTAIAAAAACALLAAACSPAGSDKSSDNASGKAGGTFVVARTGDVDKLDPHLATAFQTIETLQLIYSTLVKTDGQGKIVGDLATKWDTAADGKTVTFTLRSGVKWHDGSPFTAKDVKASIERILDQKTAAVARSNLTAIATVDATDDTTAVLHLKAPSTALLYSLTTVNASIVAAKDIAAGTIGKQPNGTGPFSWSKWDQGQQVVLNANKGYFGGAPKVASVQFRVIPDEASLLSGMKAGAFQLAILSDPAVAKQGAGQSGFKLVKEPALSYHTLMLNGRKGPLANQTVRQAIACAINRDEVLQTAAYGDGTVTGPITSPAFQYSATDGLPCTPGDTAKAKDTLASAGFGAGFTLRTIVETGEYATAVAEGQNLQAQLAKIGVKLQLQQLATSPYVTAWLAADYDAAVALNGGSYDPYLMYGRYYTTGGSLAKPAGLDSAQLDQLLRQGNAATDDNERHTIFQNLQKQLLLESPWVWLFRSDDYYLVGGKVNGFAARPDRSLISLTGAA